MATFQAAVQYRDWHGECKADDIDFGGLRDLLETRGLTNGDDFVIGFRAYIGENGRGKPLEPVSVHVLVIKAADFEAAKAALNASEPLTIGREIDFDLTAEEFLMLFKRFSVAMAWQDLDLVGREFDSVVL